MIDRDNDPVVELIDPEPEPIASEEDAGDNDALAGNPPTDAVTEP